MTEPNRVDGDRLWSRLMDMAKIGATENGGSNRQALSDDDIAGRELFVGWARAAGCDVTTDRVGNLFARRPGTDPTADPVMCGSHLDTQPTGGRFDGVYGVLGGLEVVERLNDLGVETERPVEIVVWTNEEGSRFQHSMMGSAVWAGALPLESALEMTDVDGISVADELLRNSVAGTLPAAPRPLAGYFELHIEQGPILEQESLEIGVVTGVQGLRWYEISITGHPAHAGPTPMHVRRDPARTLARIIDGVYGEVERLDEWARATFAQLRSSPVSPNTVPELLEFTLDLRHPDAATLESLESDMRQVVDAACAATGCTAEIVRRNESKPVVFDGTLVGLVRDAAVDTGYSHTDLISGAGHDACYVAGVAPAAMIFVPCEDGLSHNEAESITPAQAEAGASVLLGAVRALATAPTS